MNFYPCSVPPSVLVPFHLSCPCSVPPQDETIGPDPFYDLEQHALLGVANISLECLLHDIEFVYDAPIVAPTGKVCLSLPRSEDSLCCTLNLLFLFSEDLWEVESFDQESSKYVCSLSNLLYIHE